MTALYLVSTAAAAGKTALATAIGRRLQADRHRVAYFKPVTGDDPRADLDRQFVAAQLRLAEPPPAITSVGQAGRTGLREQLKARFRETGAADVVLVEGPPDLRSGAEPGLGPDEIAEAIDARVLLVSRYPGPAVVDEIAGARDRFGDRLLGVVLNAVPAERLARAEAAMRPVLAAVGIPLLAALPYDRTLAGVTIAELAEQIGGQFVTAADVADELVASLMIGSMSLEFAKAYFDRMADKAVIAYTDKPEVQLAALESPTKCLISCGKGRPSPVIVNRSEELGVPIVQVRDKALAVADRIGDCFGQARFHQAKKLPILERLLNASFDFAALYRSLDLVTQAARS